MPAKKHLVVLSGSGISAESGLATFRDSGGLWEGYDVYKVATPEAWNANPELVLDFYNMRRSQLLEVEPNAAHNGFERLESQFEVSIVTQNVDDLHERAGSTNVYHLHGELTKARSVINDNLIYEIGYRSISLGDKAEDGGQLRPHIVWFGEMVPMLEEAASVVSTADILVVVGTSLVVYPAASLVNYAPSSALKYIVDPSTPELLNYDGWNHIKKPATVGIKELEVELNKNYV